MIPLSHFTPKMSKELIETAKEWASIDPNKLTVGHVIKLVEENKVEDIKRLFSGRIGFGTAGLRAKMEPGPLGMNDLTVLQASQGLAEYCLKYASVDGGKNPMAVVGYDHRSNANFNLSSKRFAIVTKLAMEHAGIKCILLDGYVPTPLVAFSVENLWKIHTDYVVVAGVMVTASHNPKQDAGYKVYYCDGCQIRPPIDTGIADCIGQNLKPWFDYATGLDACEKNNGTLTNAAETERLREMYYAAVENKLVKGCYEATFKKFNEEWKSPKVIYTAMHGVGAPYAKRSFATFGFPETFYHVVPAQENPDPEFPTVSFPNPEEKGALDLAMEIAEEKGFDLILANDPDADRLAVAERSRKTGEWICFTGDQIGTLLGKWMWDNYGKFSKKPVAMCASTVSSKMLSCIGEKDGFRMEETLTGFKWIGSRAQSLRDEGSDVIFAYEEAIGFCCGDVVSDKDGLTALGIFSELSISIYSKKVQVIDHLQHLYQTYGEFVSKNGYFFCYDPPTITRILGELRNGGKYMGSVGPYKVKAIRDLGEPAFDSTTPDKKPTLPTSKSSPMLTIRFENGCVAQFRASGTEPKFKYYIELPGPPGVARDVVEADLAKMVDIILEELLRPTKNGLVKP